MKQPFQAINDDDDSFFLATADDDVVAKDIDDDEIMDLFSQPSDDEKEEEEEEEVVEEEELVEEEEGDEDSEDKVKEKALMLELDAVAVALEWAMKQALQHRVDAAERREFDMAMEQRPDLVQHETPLADFLWAENNRPHRAALRLVRYWKARRFAFGNDRWLSPLTQTGTGALCEREVELVRSGYSVPVLRPNGAGGVVVILDKSRLPFAPTEESFIRLMFYWTCVYAKMGGIRTGPWHIIHLENGAPRPLLPLMATDAFAIFNVALPVKFHRRKVFVVRACHQPGREALVDYFAFRTVQFVQFNSKTKVHHVAGKSIRHTLELLQRASGVARECLPLCVGGTNDHHRFFHEWMRAQISTEIAMIDCLTKRTESSLLLSDSQMCCCRRTKASPTPQAIAIDMDNKDEKDDRSLSVSLRGEGEQRSSSSRMERPHYVDFRVSPLPYFPVAHANDPITQE